MVKVASDRGHSPQHTKAASFIRSRDFSRSACCALTGTGGFTTTTVATSSRPAVTLSQSSPGRGTATVRSRSIPNCAAASSPRSGTPTKAIHSPACDGPATKAVARLGLSTAYASPVLIWMTPDKPGNDSRTRETAGPCIRCTRCCSSWMRLPALCEVTCGATPL
jgi:hypothetical protein